jgi:TusA-related sulfurtransferase
MNEKEIEEGAILEVVCTIEAFTEDLIVSWLGNRDLILDAEKRQRLLLAVEKVRDAWKSVKDLMPKNYGEELDNEMDAL